jgi:Rieske Fe-S protein
VAYGQARETAAGLNGREEERFGCSCHGSNYALHLTAAGSPRRGAVVFGGAAGERYVMRTSE